MASPANRAPTGDVRRLEAGPLLVGLGALILLVSLFLEWYAPDDSAWAIFETWDVVLAALCLGALVAVAGRMGVGGARPDSWLLVPAVVAFVIVVVSLLDHPPAARGFGNDPEVGLWLALAATLLMVVGALLSVTRISIAVNLGQSRMAGPARGPGEPGEGPTRPPVEPRTAPTRAPHDPLR